jgi:hypothetical protein
MKKIILIVFFSLMFANIGFAETRIIENMDRTDKKNEFVPNFITVCIDNYKFAVSKFHEGISMVQFYELDILKGDFQRPARC